jgi:hypothetical protein
MPGKINHPKTSKNVHRLFVASGKVDASDGFHFIVGRMKSPSTTLNGKTLATPDPNRWAIYFNFLKLLPGGSSTEQWTLEVFGIKLGDDGTPSSKRIDSANIITISDRMPHADKGFFDVPTITWPNSLDETNLCTSNFNPYGTYSPSSPTAQDSISVTLRGGASQTASFYYEDPSSSFWASQFDNFDPPASASTLSVTVNGNKTLGGITFQNPAC